MAETRKTSKRFQSAKLLHQFVKLQYLIMLCFFFSLHLADARRLPTSDKKLYIVYMGSNNHMADAEATTAAHHDLLAGILGSAGAAAAALVHSYRHGFSGFSAMLSDAEVATISGMPDVVSAFQSVSYSLHTTRSWDYMGLNLQGPGLWTAPSFGEDVIVATIDTGVWPEHESFDDAGVGPIPPRWRGECEVGQNFTASDCNRKLIGARYIANGYEAVFGPIDTTAPGVFLSARDSAGHGTHTTTTLGGAVATNVSLDGLARGDARGGAPGSRVAAYKVCWPGSCQSADVLAAFDVAIRDGVDVISVSLGGAPVDYFYDTIAIGSFHATENGILVAASAGNDGPAKVTVGNSAPWIFTAAASSIDREFLAEIRLSNNTTYSGPSINTEKLVPISYPLVYAGDIPALNVTSGDASMCGPQTLDATKVKGSIVVCVLGDMFEVNFPEEEVHAGGGVGTILIAENLKTFGQVFQQQAVTVVSQGVGNHILAYINNTRNPAAMMTPTVTNLGAPAPLAATFSSRGPNPVTADIFKPDVTAPGVAILAGWSPVASPSEDPSDARAFEYNILSGTSMSSPHLGGAAALVKSVYPHWSPAAIKSALMTTAVPLNTKYEQNSDWNLAWGSGHIDPRAAMDPGLVYDTTMSDYAAFFCSLNYTQGQVGIITGNRAPNRCPPNIVPSVNNLNYPSIAVSNMTKLVEVVRTATNVGDPDSVYNVTLHHPSGVHVTVTPTTLKFTPVEKKLVYTVTLSPTAFQPWTKEWVFGAVIWEDGKHMVRTPIAVGPTMSDPFIP